ncbi:MAG: beta-aspartyl-peptidase [Gammaproteobacteria bacterium]|nr:beta-aspartyl-peptidase [Gammaproteobacteria bacterium]NNC98110.1 beta-aspartyl-peptidase [Gammaproteobacteria bacterium]NNM13174.1 beta-aspartyl-peptidase [Gammaproteobacteria bacterium]
MLKLIKNAHVFAPDNLGIQHLLIGGGKILWMGADLPALEKTVLAETYDAQGLVLMPGLIDGHAHITGGGGESGYASRVPAVGLSRFTQSGVTTVVGLLGTDDTTRDTKSLLAEVRALRAQGMHALCYTGGYHIPPTTFTGCVRSDIVNLEPVIGVGEIAICDHRSSQPTLQEILRLASDAHVAGMMTGKAGILHIHLGDGESGLQLVRDALSNSELPARVFHPTHINRRKALFIEACELAKLGCSVDITAFPVADGEDAWCAADAWENYHASGAPADKLTISSDGGGCLPEFDADGQIVHMDIGDPCSLFDSIKDLLQRGISLEKILPAYTSNVARLLRLSSKGHIAHNVDADLVLMDKEHQIHSVMCQGNWHRKYHQQIITGSFENS